MKTLIILSMALVASNAFFLPRDFFDDISHRFMDLHTAVRPHQGPQQRPHPPFLPETTNDATHQRMQDLFESLTPEEQAAMKNHLFGQRNPRPMPASARHGGHSKFSDEQLAAARAKWESMTPEERQAFRAKHSNDREEEIKPRHPRSVKAAHHNNAADHHQKMSDEKLEEIRARWEAMTPEEREAVKNGKRKHYKANETPLGEKPMVRSPRQFQAIKPLPEMIDNNQPIIRKPRSIQSIQPLPEMMDKPMMRSPRQFQGIIPLPEMIDNHPPMVRNPRPFMGVQTLPEIQRQPGFIQFQPFKVAINPESDYADMMEKLKGMSAEDQIKYIRSLYPEGMPIRPLKQFLDNAYGHDVNMRPIAPNPRTASHTDEMKIKPYIFPFPIDQPLFPIGQPLLPLEIQPIFPIPAQLLGGADEEEDDEDDEDKEDDEKFMPY